MRIGLLSDTHGQLARTRRGAQLLRAQGVAHVFHCGDIGSQEVLLALAEVLGPAGIPVTAVSGNMDRYDPLVLEFPGLDGVRVAGLSWVPITPFALKDAANALQGEVKASGVFLRDEGSAGTLQQIDLTV